MENQLTRLLIFINIFSFMIGLAYFYVGSRILEGYILTKLSKILFWVILILLTVLTPATYLSSLFLDDSKWQKVLAYVAFTSIGFITILFSLVIFYDFSFSVVRVFHWIYSIFLKTPEIIQISPNSINRKEFIISLLKPAVALTSVSLTGYGFYTALNKVAIKNINIPIPDLHPDLNGFRIVQISDIHIGPTIRKDFLKSVVNKINNLDADLVAITGDLVDGSVSRLREHISPLKDINSKYGTYFVTGNHEYYSGVFSWISEIKKLGIKTLINENETIVHKKAKLLLAGVTDYKAGSIIQSHTTDPFKAIKSEDELDYKILLAHQPNSVYESARAGFDLQLSGHTHGGQYFPGTFLIHLFQKYVAGLYKHENTWLYVSSGTGYWGPPLRIGAPAEITVIELKSS